MGISIAPHPPPPITIIIISYVVSITGTPTDSKDDINSRSALHAGETIVFDYRLNGTGQ